MKKFLSIVLCIALVCAFLPGTFARASAKGTAYPVDGGNIYFDKESGTITGADPDVTSANIPAQIEGASVTNIGESAFSLHESLRSVTIPDSVTKLSLAAFDKCKNLTEAIIGNGVTTIDKSVFIECASLKTVTIGASVTSIGHYAFYNCGSLTDVYYNGTMAQWKAISIGAYNDCLQSAVIHCVDGKINQTTNDAPEPSVGNPFDDVRSADYFYEPVMWAVENEITKGLSANKFGPGEPCTRGQIVTFLWRACGSPAPKTSENPFSDVLSGGYYYSAVLWAVENGITSGVSSTRFAPDDVCTRGQVATFLWRSQGEPVPENKGSSFSDVNESAYYYQAILWAAENNITQGTGNGKFSPNDSCTRGQIVTFLYRALAK